MIRIDYNKDEYLDDFAHVTLRDRYLKEGESPQDAFARAATAFSDSQGMAQRMYNYMSNQWMTTSSPILSNAPKRLSWVHGEESVNSGTFESIPRSMPISCFLTYVDDSIDGLNEHTVESRVLSISGGGIGAHWSQVRSVSDKAPGPIPFLKTHDADVNAYHQGTTRRGAYAAYMDISHPDIEEFIVMRSASGGDSNRKCLNLHHGVNLTEEFVQAVQNDEIWKLIDPHSGEVKKVVPARQLWMQILETRHKTGEPYITRIDKINEALPETQKALGLKVHGSNLCTEITLPTDVDRTAVCCLSSVNLEKFDEWSKNPDFIYDIVRYLDNVLDYFILHAGDDLAKAKYSAMRERSIGIGALGFHAYLQSKGIPFESALAVAANRRMFKHIQERAIEATRRLAMQRGEAPDMLGTGRRNAHLLAIAPNATSSIYGGTSPSVEPWKANAFSHRTLSGTFLVKNKYLDAVIKDFVKQEFDQGFDPQVPYDAIWKSILMHKGSVQHLQFLTDYQKDVFKTAMEIDQNWVVQHALDRQPYICQAQSINLFFPSEVDVRYLHGVHWRAVNGGLKTLYYLRSEALRRAETVSVKIERDFITNPAECLACE